MRRGMVSILITSYNSAPVLGHCLDSLRQQDYAPLEVIIVDNASSDATRALLESLEDKCRIVHNPTNVGFAAAQNQALRLAQGEWILSLNPDVVLAPNFITELVTAAETDPSAGTVCGKLLRWTPGTNPSFSRVIDSTGIYFLKNLRHLDRGAEEVDTGQYDSSAYVFGSTGAAALYRRRMIEDISVMGEFFDEDFFAYREDADLSWRAQLMGWRCLYNPRAVGWHVRRVTPSRFRELPLFINWHSVKNRFLMRVKNISWRLYLRLFLPVTWRDGLILAYSLLVDRRLLSALHYIWERRHEMRRKRQWIQSRRRVSDRELARWFSNGPVSFAPERPAEGRQPSANDRAGQ
jgi:GT2 family glycosyltransferase